MSDLGFLWVHAEQWEVELDPTALLLLAFLGPFILVSVVSALPCIPANTYCIRVPFSPSSSPACIVCFLDDRHAGSVEMESLLFWFAFPWWLKVLNTFSMSLLAVCTSFEKHLCGLFTQPTESLRMLIVSLFPNVVLSVWYFLDAEAKSGLVALPFAEADSHVTWREAGDRDCFRMWPRVTVVKAKTKGRASPTARLCRSQVELCSKAAYYRSNPVLEKMWNDTRFISTLSHGWEAAWRRVVQHERDEESRQLVLSVMRASSSGLFYADLARPFQSPSIIAEDICEGAVGTVHQMLSFAMASQTWQETNENFLQLISRAPAFLNGLCRA